MAYPWPVPDRWWVRDRLRDGPERLQAPFFPKSPLQTAFQTNTLNADKPTDVQGLL
jgi:hypothetical protein